MSGGLLVTLALGFAAVFVTAYLLLGATARRRAERELAMRMVHLAATELGPVPSRPELPTGWVPEPLVVAADRLAGASGMQPWMEGKLERAGMPLRSGELLALSFAAGVGGLAVGGLVLRSILFAVVIGAAAAAAPFVWVLVVGSRRVTRLFAQIPDTLAVLASSLRAGHSFFQALDMVAREIGEPASEEFSRVVSEIRLGRPVDEALLGMADRVGSDDLRWAVLAVNIQREIGGNLAEILETVAETVRDREQIRRQVDVLSAEGRISMWILVVLPFAVGLFIARMNPHYIALLFTTALGLAIVAVAATLMTVGIFWMRKVVRIDV